MALTSRLALTGPDTTDPEDYLSSSLGIIFPDDVTNQHGDADHGLLYTSPHLPQPLQFSLANVTEEKERHLFSHYLWNSSLMLAELIEAGTLGLDIPWSGLGGEIKDFDATGLETVELGAGTALPSIMGGLMGSKRVVVTDYPAPEVIKTLKENVLRGVEKKNGVDGRGFFDKEKLAEVGLEVERLWERDCDGGEREWVWDRGVEDISVRKRWLAVGVLRRIRKSE
ncbi:uncharacterized protein QC763_211940 [Podospora pseudopauciseta]|uniref:Nicotinamide N-methyltransferase n=2 Tax=Podospora TaxID=5144 RepID=A0ABR0HRU4_9PEZI|nr:hypothetical protein QC763_211940 [Podospora pseudopauciseta]KAK4680306.1 hypothetical protein QC764_211940 [Podospora pseudoanserina]